MAVGKLDNVIIVLVGTKYAGNLGAVARAMANMGLSQLRMVRPVCSIDAEAIRMARSGKSILAAARRCRTLRGALRGVGLVVGTTARTGGNRPEFHTPRDLAPGVLDLAQAGKAAIVFGPEDTGLVDDDILLCHRLVRIPTVSAARSLNLSQAVLLVCYELFLAQYDREPRLVPKPAGVQELEAMYGHLEDALRKIGFLHEKNARHMMFSLRRILGRVALESADAALLRGIARQIDWFSRHGNPRDGFPGRAC